MGKCCRKPCLIQLHLKNIESSLQYVSGTPPPRDKTPEKQAAAITSPQQQLLLHEEKQEKKSEIPKRKLSFRSNKRKLSTNTNDGSPASEIKRSIIADINSDYEEDADDDDYNDNSLETNRFQNIAEASFTDYLDQYDPLPRKYIVEMYEDKDNKESDHKYGVRLDTSTEKFLIGNSQLDLVGSDIHVHGKRYRGTQGLYELMFKKYPNMALCSAEDVANYKHIVYKTNAHRRHYKSNAQVDGSKLKKYKKIIAPTVGTGLKTTMPQLSTMMEVTFNKKDYIYWDDPNELVNRLRLLLASQAAGHTGHLNEINSIIEELREAEIIT